MNKVILMGRLTRDPEIRYANNENNTCIANYTLAVDRRFKRQGDEQTADFIRCVAMGKGGEFTMEQEYGVHFLFCHPNEAGAKVVELLEGGCDDDRRTKAVG